MYQNVLVILTLVFFYRHTCVLKMLHFPDSHTGDNITTIIVASDSERPYRKEHQILMVYLVTLNFSVNNSRTRRVGEGGEQILCYRTPPGRLEIFKKRLCRMDAGNGQMVYVYFHNPTCPRDFPGTDFLIFRYSGCG